jgi:pimeloyl-ACP methyl ester carboxylesterase
LFAGPFRWQDLTTPLVVGVGSTSTAPSARDARRLAVLLDSPLIALAGAGHPAHRTHPALFAELVRRTVARTGSRRSGLEVEDLPEDL